MGPTSARDHRRIPEASDTIKVKITRGLLRKGHQVLFMSRDDTGGARSQTRRSGTLRDCSRILESFNILEAEHTRAVVAKNRHLKLLEAYKTKLHWGFSEAINSREPLKRGYQVVPRCKGNTGEARLQGRDSIFMSKGDNGEARLQGREALLMSKGDTVKAEMSHRSVVS